LMIGIANQFELMIHETFMNGYWYRGKLDIGF